MTSFSRSKKKNKSQKKTAEKALADLKKLIDEESKPVTKKKFDYDIPIAKVEDAGITTTGAASEGNQLPALVNEYKEYRITNILWQSKSNAVTYGLNSDGSYCRMENGREVVLNG